MIGKWGFSLLPFYLGIIPIFANNNYTLTLLAQKPENMCKIVKFQQRFDLFSPACYYGIGTKSAGNSLSDSGEDNA